MVPLVLVVLAVALLTTRVVARRRRRSAIAARATAREWTYLQSDRSLLGCYQGPPFDLGSLRWASHVVRGRYDGRELVAFAYSHLVAGEGIDGRSTQRALGRRPVGRCGPPPAGRRPAKRAEPVRQRLPRHRPGGGRPGVRPGVPGQRT